MVRVRRYRDTGTDLQAVYKGVKEFLQGTKDLNITNEINGKMDGKPFLSISAVKASVPRLLVGSLREVTVSITGSPEDFLVEVHTGSWFSNIAMPGVAGILIAGPVGFAVGAGTPTILALDYERRVWKKVRELVEKHGKKKLELKKVEVY
jgi:hypothetical protein